MEMNKTCNVLYVYLNIEALSRYPGYRGKAILRANILIVCSLIYPACKAHVPYSIVICGLSDSSVFFKHYFINGTIFGKKKKLNIKCVL